MYTNDRKHCGQRRVTQSYYYNLFEKIGWLVPLSSFRFDKFPGVEVGGM